MSTFWVVTVLAALALSFLSIVATENHFQSQQANDTKAYYAARSGVEYLASRGLTTLPSNPDGSYLLSIDPASRCVMTQDSTSGNISCIGQVVTASGKVVALRTLVVPPSNLQSFQEQAAASPSPSASP
jgi:hypothetical protein